MVFRSLVLAFVCAASSGFAQSVEFTPEEAREVAIAAVNAGDFETAHQLSDVLLQRNAKDVSALIVRARVAIALGDFEDAKTLAGSAFSLSSNEHARFAAARVVALAHANQNEFTRAQFWLRRARQVAPDAEARALAAQDFRIVTARNPLSVSFSFGISPSNNVNNGSSNSRVVAPDWANFLKSFLGSSAVVGDVVDLSAGSQAIKGFNIQAGLRLGYTLGQTPTSRTTLTFGASANQVVFTAAEKAANPTIDPRAYSTQSLSFGLDRVWAADDGGYYAISPEVSQVWYGGSILQQSLTLDAKRFWAIDERNGFTLLPRYEWTRYPASSDQSQTFGVSAQWQHVLETGGRLGFDVTTNKVSAADPLKASFGGGISVSYSHPAPVFGFDISGTVGQSWRRFEGWNGGAGTRSDATFNIGLDVAAPKAEIYGFVPVMSLSGSATQSDRDLYDKTVTSIGLNFRSAF